MYEVGDKVRIREDLVDDPYRYPPVGINDSMVALAGSDATIIKREYRVDLGRRCRVYRLNIDYGSYAWINEMLDSAIRHSSKELYEVWGDNT